MTAATAKSQALLAAVDLVAENGVPKDYEDTVELVALAYARGCRDAAVKALELWSASMVDALTDPRDST